MDERMDVKEIIFLLDYYEDETSHPVITRSQAKEIKELIQSLEQQLADAEEKLRLHREEINEIVKTQVRILEQQLAAKVRECEAWKEQVRKDWDKADFQKFQYKIEAQLRRSE
jgi:hypothetical protein